MILKKRKIGSALLLEFMIKVRHDSEEEENIMMFHAFINYACQKCLRVIDTPHESLRTQ